MPGRAAAAVAALALAPGAVLGGCQPEGERARVSTEIAFTRGGAPAADEPIYRLEQIGGRPIVTALLRTDARGRLRIEGEHCLPLLLAGSGGFAGISPGTALPLPPIPLDQPPSAYFRQLGPPQPEFADWSARQPGCG